MGSQSKLKLHNPSCSEETKGKKIRRIDSTDTPPHVGAGANSVALARVCAGRDAISRDHEEHHDAGVTEIEIGANAKSKVVAHNAKCRQATPRINHRISRFPLFSKGRLYLHVQGHG